MIFLPIINSNFFNCPVESYSEEEMRAILQEFFDYAVVLEFSINDCSLSFDELTTFRSASPAFKVKVRQDFLFGPLCDPAPEKGDILDPVVSDGYWVLLSPLPPGNYEAHFHGVVDHPEWGGFETEMTYHLSVTE